MSNLFPYTSSVTRTVPYLRHHNHWAISLSCVFYCSFLVIFLHHTLPQFTLPSQFCISDVTVIHIYLCFLNTTYLSPSLYATITPLLYTIFNIVIPPSHTISFPKNVMCYNFSDLVWSLRYNPLWSLCTDCSALILSLSSNLINLIHSSLSALLIWSACYNPIHLILMHFPSFHFNKFWLFPLDMTHLIFSFHIWSAWILLINYFLLHSALHCLLFHFFKSPVPSIFT